MAATREVRAREGFIDQLIKLKQSKHNERKNLQPLTRVEMHPELRQPQHCPPTSASKARRGRDPRPGRARGQGLQHQPGTGMRCTTRTCSRS